jgi:hypothetical protein
MVGAALTVTGRFDLGAEHLDGGLVLDAAPVRDATGRHGAGSSEEQKRQKWCYTCDRRR